MSAEMESTSIQVVVRMRPLNERETKFNTCPVVTANTQRKEVLVIKGAGNRQQRTTYNFDNVLGTHSSQEEVFQQTIQPVIADVLGGFECTMFAYGQTGTGKTHTMEGDLSNEENQGIIPRAAQAIFDLLGDPKFRESQVTASYLEIYNEELSDLLTDDGKEAKLQICEDNKPRGKGLFVQNLSETTVTTPSDVLGLMQRAQLRRQVGETKMNKQSSRSHCLFTLKVHSKKVVSADGSVMECTGKLHLVDLAGSECAKTAGNEKVDPAKERERKNINQSLLILGRVISALRDAPTGRIPYRDSKLTRLLQESLGGRCKTVIIATVSPSITAVDETISTLNYAQAAHGILNKPVATSYLKLGEGKSHAESGGAGGTGAGLNVQDWNQMECRLQYMQAELEEAQAALSRKHTQQQVIIDRAEAAEKDRDTLTEQMADNKDELDRSSLRNGALLAHLKLTREDVARVQCLVEARKETEGTLTTEASDVLAALSKCVADGENFHTLLIQQAQAEEQRRAKSQEFNTSSATMLKSLGAELHKYSAEVSVHLKTVVKQSKDVESSSAALLDSVMQAVVDMEASALMHTGKARDFMAHGVATTAHQLEAIKNASATNGEQLSSTVHNCQTAVKDHMALLQSQVASSEEALAKWSAHASSKLEKTSTQLSRMLQEHGSTTEADKTAAREHLSEADGILSQQKTSLEAMAADLKAQCELQQQMSDSLTIMSDMCVKTSSAHVEGAQSHAQALAKALEDQKTGQLDASVVKTLKKARSMAADNAKSLDEMGTAQKESLAQALEKQATGTINEVHAESIENARELVESSCADHGRQLTSQHVQLEGARDEQNSGNAQILHSAAIDELRATIADKMEVERAMLTEQKTGLEQAADDLEGEKENENKLIETLKAESKQLRKIVKQQKAVLEQQAQNLETQKQDLAAALAAQEKGRELMIKTVKEELDATIATELRIREEAEHAALQRIAAEKKIREEAEQAALVRVAADKKSREEAEEAALERVAAEKKSREEAEQASLERVAAEQKIRDEAEEAALERVAAEKKSREEAEKAAMEKVAAEKKTRDEAALERVAAEKKSREEAEQAFLERVAAERKFREEAEEAALERIAAEHKSREEAEEAALQRAAAEKKSRDEAALQRVAEEKKSREEAEQAFLESVAAEKKIREEAEEAALERIAAEHKSREEAEEAALQRVAAEKKSRDEAAAQRVAEEKKSREEAEQAFLESVAAEKKIREEAEEAALQRVAAETNNREEAEQAALESVAAEKKIREEAEEAALERVAEEKRIREEVEMAAKERQEKAVAKLEQMLLGQVLQLAATMNKDVSSLVGINEQITEENSNVHAQAKEFDKCTVHLQEQATEQVRAWGEAVASVQANVREMSAVNTQLAGEVEGVSKTVVDATAALEAQTAAWGESNKVVEQAVVECIAKNKKTAADVLAMQVAVDEQATMLNTETDQWRDNNHEVIEKMHGIVVENEGIAAAVASGAAAVDAVEVDAIKQVKAWGNTDRTCQTSMQTAVDDTNTLAVTMQTNQDKLHEQQAASSEQLGSLSAMTQGSQKSVEEHTASNDAAQDKANHLTVHVDKAAAGVAERIAAIEGVHSSALEELTTSVTNMMAPRPEFLASFSQDGQLLLKDMSSAVDKTSKLVAAQQSSLDAARSESVASCETTKQDHLEVLAGLDAGAASQREKATASAEQTKAAMAVGPVSTTAEADALASELASFEKMHGEGSTQLSGCVNTYCTEVAKMQETVEPAPTIGSFNTGATFSSTPSDEFVLANFEPDVDMSDISSSEQQVMPGVATDTMRPNAALELEPDAAHGEEEIAEKAEEAEEADFEPEHTMEEEETTENNENDENIPPEMKRPKTAPAVVEKSEKKRQRITTPKKSAGRQAASGTAKPAAKIAATGSSRLTAPKSRASLREIHNH